MLRAGGRVQERLCPRFDVATMKDELADLLTELGPARLTRGEDRFSVRLEPRLQKLCLRRFARAVEALEGDEHRPPS